MDIIIENPTPDLLTSNEGIAANRVINPCGYRGVNMSKCC